MSEKKKNAIWIAVVILFIILELIGVFDWIHDAIFGEDKLVRDARDQAIYDEAYDEGYKDGYSDGHDDDYDDGYKDGYYDGYWDAQHETS